MRVVILVFLFCLLSTIANAEQYQSRKVIICDKAEIIFEKLASDFEEYPIWGGKDATDPSLYALTVNKSNGSWTLVQFFKDVACVIGVGVDSQMMLKETI